MLEMSVIKNATRGKSIYPHFQKKSGSRVGNLQLLLVHKYFKFHHRMRRNCFFVTLCGNDESEKSFTLLVSNGGGIVSWKMF